MPPPGMVPPSGMMPPPWMMMPPPPPRGGGLGKALLVTFMTTILACSLGLNFWLLVAMFVKSGLSTSASLVQESTIVEGSADQKIAVLRFDGEINTLMRDRFYEVLNHVEADTSVKGVVIEIDSPGGAVTPSDEIYDRIRDLKAKKSIPVYISMNSLAASGGYYVAMAGDKVYAQETTLTGSIGVLFQRYDLTGLGEKYGIKDGTIVSDGATFKAAGSMMKPLSPTEETYFKSLLNDAFDVFKDRIAKGRPNLSKAKIDEIANGKIYSAKQALELGLIDKVGYLPDVIADLATAAGLTNPNAVRVERTPTPFESLLGGSAQSKALADVSVGSVKVGVDADALRSFMRGRLVYLAPGF